MRISRVARTRAHSVLALFVLLLLSAPLGAQATDPGQPLGIAAIVNGVPITGNMVERELRREILHMDILPEQHAEAARKLRRKVLDGIIQQRLLLQACERHKITIADDDIEREIQELVRRNSAANSQEFFKLVLESTGDSEDAIRKQTGEDLRIRALLWQRVFKEEFISPQELRTYYEENEPAFTSETVHTVRQLLIPSRQPDIDEVLKQVDAALAAQKPFEEIIQEFAPATERGPRSVQKIGDKSLDDFLSPIPEVIRGLEVGQVSARVEFPVNVYYYKLEARVPGQKIQFEQAQERIRSEISRARRSHQFERFYKQLLEQADVRVFLAESK
ncbi:MAG: SurA N-terminal domain-containing protein [Planctomycetota bacterium]